MNNSERYKNAFDTLRTDTDIDLDTLTKRRQTVKHNNIKKTLYSFAAFLALFAGSNIVTYAASGEAWITNVINLKTGNGSEVVIDNTKPDEVSVSIDADGNTTYFTVESDRLYFVFNDIKEDITDKCSEDAYYKYEYIDEQSFRHIIIVGGTIDNPGCAEYVFDTDGEYIFNQLFIAAEFEEDTGAPVQPQWLLDAEYSLGVPTGNPEYDQKWLEEN